MNRQGIGTVLLKYFGRGFVTWMAIAVCIALWKFAITPVEFITRDPLLQFLIIPCAILAMGIVTELVKKAARALRGVIVREIVPASLTGKKVVEWETGGVRVRGLLLDMEGDTAYVMEIMGGPTSITWFPRRVPKERITIVENEKAMNLILELFTLGISKNGIF